MNLQSISIENAQKLHDETGINIICDADEKAKVAHLAGCTTNRETVSTPLFYHLKQQNATPQKPYPGDIIQIREGFCALIRPGVRLWHVLGELFAA